MKLPKTYTQIASAVFIAVTSNAVLAESWITSPSLLIRTGFDDNIRLQQGVDDAAQETLLSGGIELARHTELSNTRLYGKAGYVAYTSADDSTLDDTQEYIAGLSSAYKPGERSSLGIDVEYKLDTLGSSYQFDNPDLTTDSDQGLVSSQIDRKRLSVSPKWELQVSELTKIGLAFDYEDVTFDDNELNRLTDYEYQTIRPNVVYRTGERSRISSELLFSTYETESNDQVDSVHLILGYTLQVNETSEFRISGGAHQTTIKRRAVVDDEDENGFLINAYYEKRTELSSFNARVERSLSPSGNGELLETDSISGNFSRRLSEKMNFNMYASYFTTSDVANSNDSDRKYAFAMPELSYSFLKDWSAAVSYRFRWNEDEGRLDEFNNQLGSVDSNGVFLSLQYSPDRTVR